jgi:aspartate 1-decarboxylase
MLVETFKSKIHRVAVTEAKLNYVGSITIDEDLIDAADMFVNQRVQIVNVNNGERLETYVIPGKRGSGVICLNGPAARKVEVGDVVIIIAYGFMEEAEARKYEPTVIFPDENNRLS